MRRLVVVSVLVLPMLAVFGCGDDDGGSPAAPRRVDVVRLRTEGCGLAPEIATGFSSSGGVVITAAHPLAGDAPVTRDGDPLPLTIVTLDLRADLALLEPPVMPVGAVPEFRDASVGEPVTVMVVRDGVPTPLTATVRSIAPINFHDAVAGTVVQRDGLVLSTAIVGGDSGAPVIGDDGRVLGLMFANAKESTESYAVAASEIEQVLAAPPTPVIRPMC